MNGYGAAWRKNLYRSGCSEGELALREDIPTIAELERTYSEFTVQKWIVNQLEVINNFTGVGHIMTSEQIAETANIIGARYWNWNIGEIALFVSRFCNGEYGELYGTVDPLRITSSLRKYAAQRMESLNAVKREQERIEREKENERNKEVAHSPETLEAKERFFKNHEDLFKHQK